MPMQLDLSSMLISSHFGDDAPLSAQSSRAQSDSAKTRTRLQLFRVKKLEICLGIVGN